MSSPRIYYALAIVEFMDSNGSPCLIDEVTESYTVEDGSGDPEPPSLLSDTSTLDEALKILSLSSVIEIDSDSIAPPILESKLTLSENLGFFNVDERDVVRRFYKAGNRKRLWLTRALNNLANRKSQRKAYAWEKTPVTNQPEPIPASDRYVRIDDNSKNYQSAVTALQELIEEVAQNRTNDWPEKDGILTSLRSALEMLKSKYVSKKVLLAIVGSAVGFIALKFAEAPINELASRTWNAVKALF
jgi:hypothetical protein